MPNPGKGMSRAHHGDKWWQNAIIMEIARIETTLLAVGPNTPTPLLPVAAHVRSQLRAARDVLDDYDALGRVARVGRGGKTYERALALVLQAGQDALLVASDAAVLAQVAPLRAGVRAYLEPSDSRYDAYVRFCDQVLDQATTRSRTAARSSVGHVVELPAEETGGEAVSELSTEDRETLRAIKRDVDEARLSAQTSVRSYRNVLSIAVVVLCLCAVIFPFLASRMSTDLWVIRGTAIAPTAAPSPTTTPTGTATLTQAAATPTPTVALTAAPPSSDAATGTPSASTTETPPATSPDSSSAVPVQPEATTWGDIASIEGWGVIGGLIGAIVSLRRLRSSRDPAGLHLAQLALKLPAGALTAVFGIVLLQSSIFPQLARVDDGQVAAYAVLFGFAQEALTRFVDARSGEILDNAKAIGGKK